VVQWSLFGFSHEELPAARLTHLIRASSAIRVEISGSRATLDRTILVPDGAERVIPLLALSASCHYSAERLDQASSAARQGPVPDLRLRPPCHAGSLPGVWYVPAKRPMTVT